MARFTVITHNYYSSHVEAAFELDCKLELSTVQARSRSRFCNEISQQCLAEMGILLPGGVC